MYPFFKNDYGSEHSSLSRPYRTYPQKSVDWSLHHHNMNMEKLIDHSGNNSPPHLTNKMEFQHEPPPSSQTGNIPNGHMQKVSSLVDIENGNHV